MRFCQSALFSSNFPNLNVASFTVWLLHHNVICKFHSSGTFPFCIASLVLIIFNFSFNKQSIWSKNWEAIIFKSFWCSCFRHGNSWLPHHSSTHTTTSWKHHRSWKINLVLFPFQDYRHYPKLCVYVSNKKAISITRCHTLSFLLIWNLWGCIWLNRILFLQCLH